MKSLLLAALLLLPQEKPKVTDPQYVVVFEIRQNNMLTDPVAHVNVLVNATSEGDAAIKAYAYLTVFSREESRLKFLEAAARK
jgi:hypothetical protein